MFNELYEKNPSFVSLDLETCILAKPNILNEVDVLFRFLTFLAHSRDIWGEIIVLGK